MTAVLPLASLAADQKIYKIGGNVSTPVPIHKPQPAYTPEARDAKVEGGVLIAAILGPDGKLSEITVERSLEPSLDRSAVDTLKTWLFKPALKDGVPVSVSVHIEINFRLL
jgi:TonB family protein